MFNLQFVSYFQIAFNNLKFTLFKQKKSMEIIQNLQQRRKEHDRKISKLLDISNTISKSQIQSQKDCRLSGLSQVQNQVNLLSSMLASNRQMSTNIKANGKKYEPNEKINFKIGINKKEVQFDNEGNGNFQDLIDYLTNNELWDDIICQQEGKCCVHFFQNGARKVLFADQIVIYQEEKSLLIEDDDAFFADYLLLYKALSGCKRRMSYMLRRLFGYPITIYDLTNPSHCLQFANTIQTNFDSQSVFAYGLQKNAQAQQFLTLKDKEKINNIQIKYLPHFFQEICVVYIESELNCKNIQLKHRQNHYVVVDLLNYSLDLFYLTLSCREYKNDLYKICIMSKEGKIVQHGIVKTNQSFLVDLPQGQYSAYISNYNSIEDPQFNLCVQSSSSFQLQLRLLPQYNNFVQTLIQTYIDNLQEIHVLPKPSLLRCCLKMLGFVADIYCLEEQIEVQYEDINALCSPYYRKKSIKIRNKQGEYYTIVYLNNFSNIKKISNETSIKVKTVYV